MNLQHTLKSQIGWIALIFRWIWTFWRYGRLCISHPAKTNKHTTNKKTKTKPKKSVKYNSWSRFAETNTEHTSDSGGNYTFIYILTSWHWFTNSPRFIKHASIVVTKPFNIIHKDRLNYFLLSLEGCTLNIKQNNKCVGIHQLYKGNTDNGYQWHFLYLSRLTYNTNITKKMFLPCCHLCRVASGVMAELGGGNS